MNNINYETIISSFDDKGTLLKWLKTIDAELQGSKVTSSSWRVVEGEESNTAYLTLTTSDGVNFETEGLVIPKTTSAMIINVINQAIATYDEPYYGASTLQEFVEHIESILDNVLELFSYSGYFGTSQGNYFYFNNVISPNNLNASNISFLLYVSSNVKDDAFFAVQEGPQGDKHIGTIIKVENNSFTFSDESGNNTIVNRSDIIEYKFTKVSLQTGNTETIEA